MRQEKPNPTLLQQSWRTKPNIAYATDPMSTKRHATEMEPSPITADEQKDAKTSKIMVHLPIPERQVEPLFDKAGVPPSEKEAKEDTPFPVKPGTSIVVLGQRFGRRVGPDGRPQAVPIQDVFDHMRTTNTRSEKLWDFDHPEFQKEAQDFNNCSTREKYDTDETVHPQREAFFASYRHLVDQGQGKHPIYASNLLIWNVVYRGD